MALFRGAVALLLLGLTHAQEYAVARPFATAEEIGAFQRSFDAWNSVVPCDGSSSRPVDLYLVYSRAFESSPSALAAASRIATEFEGGNQAWHRCFRSVQVLSANLTAEQDQYDPLGQDTNPNWVSGPNNVFRYVLRRFLSMNYDAFFFMELDSWPKREFWLEQFIREAQVPGVAIRGSRYRGDKWDHFLTELPEAILAHINGNAIYFPKHPLMRWLAEQLDMDASSSMASVAFDVRMSQLVIGAKDTALWPTLAPLAADPYLSDSRLIGNYAGTLLNASFDGGEFVTHVASSNIFTELESARVTLAVSHFSSANFSLFSDSVPTYHPFREIQMLTKDSNARDGAVDEIATPLGTTRMTWKIQTGPTNMTLCELAGRVTTEFFAFTDTFHAISSPVSILMSGSKPLLPYMWATSRYCNTDGRCMDSLLQAEELFGTVLERHYETFDTLFITAKAQAFCTAWVEAERLLLARNPSSCLPITGPSADDYVAWLQATQGGVESFYKLENREQKGWREFTILHTAHLVDPRPCGQYGEAQYQSTIRNISSCGLYVEQPGDCNADSECQWRPIFRSGKCIPNLGDLTSSPAFEDWTVTTTKAATPAPTPAPQTTPLPTPLPTPAPTPAPVGMVPTETATTTITTTQTETKTETLPPGFVTSTETTTTTIPLSKFASCVLKLNTKIPLKRLVRMVKKGAEMQIQRARNSKVKKVVITMEIESLQFSSIFVKIVLTLQKRSRGIRALKKAYCKSLGPERCELSNRGANGLKQRRKGRKLQDAVADNELPFEAFAVLSMEVEVDEINELKDDTFMPALQAAMLEEFPTESFADLNATALSAIDETAEAILTYSVPETDADDVPELQREVANSTEIGLAFAAAESFSSLVAPPIVDLCMLRDCTGNGNCTAGICICEKGWWGVNCALKAPVAGWLPFSVTVPIEDEQIPLIVSMSLLATCFIWVIPCFIIYYKKKKNAEEANNNKKMSDEGSDEKNADMTLEVTSSESEDAFI